MAVQPIVSVAAPGMGGTAGVKRESDVCVCVCVQSGSHRLFH